jgi:hypothetical protein
VPGARRRRSGPHGTFFLLHFFPALPWLWLTNSIFITRLHVWTGMTTTNSPHHTYRHQVQQTRNRAWDVTAYQALGVFFVLFLFNQLIADRLCLRKGTTTGAWARGAFLFISDTTHLTTTKTATILVITSTRPTTQNSPACLRPFKMPRRISVKVGYKYSSNNVRVSRLPTHTPFTLR